MNLQGIKIVFIMICLEAMTCFSKTRIFKPRKMRERSNLGKKLISITLKPDLKSVQCATKSQLDYSVIFQSLCSRFLVNIDFTWFPNRIGPTTQNRPQIGSEEKKALNEVSLYSLSGFYEKLRTKYNEKVSTVDF